MGLNLNNVYQRPYVAPDRRNQIKRRQDEEQATSNAQKEQQADQNSKSKGLQYTEQQPQRAYQATQNNIAYQQYQAVNTPQAEVTYPNEVATALAQRNPNINIAQILKDFKNTAIAIGTPDDLKEEVYGYIELIEKQVVKEKPNSKLIKS